MTPIQVVGIGLDGAAGLPPAVSMLIQQAAILAGSDRCLSYFPDFSGPRWSLAGLEARLQAHLHQPQPALVVVLTSGDPLFFGLGRQLLQQLPAQALTFHPHPTSVQLAFSRIKVPWQNAALVSAHGRSLDQLEQALKSGQTPVAVLTDTIRTPAAIASWIQDLALPTRYRLWVCENLGGANERVRNFSVEAAQKLEAAPLTVVILDLEAQSLVMSSLPLLGIPDHYFLSFADRPGLMTKQAVRVQILAELALQSRQVVWDIGAGTGSVSIEVARLCPDSQVWAVEKTTAGADLIRKNIVRFSTPNVCPLQGEAPQALGDLPAPDRAFIGGSSGQLQKILSLCAQRLRLGGRIVVALATLESLATVTRWLSEHPTWRGQFQQISLARSHGVGGLTRWSPLNPITLATLRPLNSQRSGIQPPNQTCRSAQQ